MVWTAIFMHAPRFSALNRYMSNPNYWILTAEQIYLITKGFGATSTISTFITINDFLTPTSYMLDAARVYAIP